VKVTNLCPYAGNEAWCAYDVNSHGYEAHFDLMDYNMAGVVSSMGWNNPEVTYEEVDCAKNGYTDWECQCADGASTITPSATAAPATKTPAAPVSATEAPTAAPVPATQAPATEAPTAAPVPATQAPATEAPIAPTEAPIAVATDAPVVAATEAPVPATEAPVVAATDAPVIEPSTAATDAPISSQSPSTSANIKIQVNGGSNAWWFGFSLVNIAVSDISSVEIKDSSATSMWTRLSYQGNEYWNMYSVNPSTQMKAPLSLRFTSVNGNVVTANNIISAFQSATIDTGVAL
jgi:hypothetical protein